MKRLHRNLIACGSAAFLAAALSSAAYQAATNSVNPDLKKKQDQLTLENSVADQQLKKELATLAAEKQRLELENGLAQQKQQAKQAAVQAELDELNKKIDLLAKRTALK